LTSTDTVATHHIGRSFADTHLEDKCPCPKAACGLVPRDQVVEECGQHHWTSAKTIRQSHPAAACPGAPAEPDPLTEQQLTDIETRANAATPGPWCTDSWEIYQGTEYVAGAEWIGETCRAGEMDDGRADAEFVAAARTDVPALLAYIRHQETVIVELRAALEAVDAAR
jgi:hypothetical protein